MQIIVEAEALDSLKAMAQRLQEDARLIEPMGDYCGGHGEARVPSPIDCAKTIRASK